MQLCPLLGPMVGPEARCQYLGLCNVNIFCLIFLRYTVNVGILGHIERSHQRSSNKTSM